MRCEKVRRRLAKIAEGTAAPKLPFFAKPTDDPALFADETSQLSAAKSDSRPSSAMVEPSQDVDIRIEQSNPTNPSSENISDEERCVAVISQLQSSVDNL